jgi:hypothetical protein
VSRNPALFPKTGSKTGRSAAASGLLGAIYFQEVPHVSTCIAPRATLTEPPTITAHAKEGCDDQAALSQVVAREIMRGPMENRVDIAYCTPVAVQLREWDLAWTMRGGWGFWCFLSMSVLMCFVWFWNGVSVYVANTGSKILFGLCRLSCHLTTQDGSRLHARLYFPEP